MRDTVGTDEGQGQAETGSILKPNLMIRESSVILEVKEALSD